jgi:hypothetical protein
MTTRLLFLLFLLPYSAIGQDGQDRIQLNRPQWNKTLNNAFLTILGAKSDNAQIGNYASLDPVAGSFTFKGSIPIGKEDSKRISYLSLLAKGDLISDSYASLFSNSKLNTNVGIEAQWHVRLGSNHFTVKKSVIGQYTYESALLQHKMEDATIRNELLKEKVEGDVELMKYQFETLDSQIAKTKRDREVARQITDNLFRQHPTDVAAKKKWADSLVRISGELEKFRADSASLQFKHDSLTDIIADWSNYSYNLDQHVFNEYERKNKSLDSLLSIEEVEFNWFTITAGTGKKKYYTYREGIPFSEQITKNTLATWKIGITWNYFFQSRLNQQAYYINFGISRGEDNNTALLVTQEVVQEKVVKNTVGDTTRKISQKYNVYTDTIVSVPQWNLAANFYYLFGKRTSGLHFFPTLNIPDNNKSYTNLGLGYIVSFINNKKDQPIINAEGYVQFNDVFNSTEIPGTFWNRNEIGIRFSLPIALLSK